MEPPAKRVCVEPAHVYIYRSGLSDKYKVGYSRQGEASRRQKGLSTGNPEPLMIMAKFTVQAGTPAQAEHAAHTLLELESSDMTFRRLRNRLAKEWFHVVDYDQFLETVGRAIADHNAAAALKEQAKALGAEDVALPPLAADDELMALVQQRYQLKAQSDQLQTQQAAIEDRIRLLLDKRGAAEHEGHEFITFRSVKRNIFDQPKFREQYPDLFKQLRKDTISRPLIFH